MNDSRSVSSKSTSSEFNDYSTAVEGTSVTVGRVHSERVRFLFDREKNERTVESINGLGSQYHERANHVHIMKKSKFEANMCRRDDFDGSFTSCSDLVFAKPSEHLPTIEEYCKDKSSNDDTPFLFSTRKLESDKYAGRQLFASPEKDAETPSRNKQSISTIPFSSSNKTPSNAAALSKFDGAVSYTPLQTPRANNVKVVTRSTARIKNPYAKNRQMSDKCLDTGKERPHCPITPVPFRFNHVSGTLSGKPISPDSLAKSVAILQRQKQQHDPTYSKNKLISDVKRNGSAPAPTPLRMKSFKNISQVLDYGVKQPTQIDFQRKNLFKGYEGTISLAKLAQLNGPMQDDTDSCSRHGVKPVVLRVTSSNAAKLRFSPETKEPYFFSGDANLPPGLSPFQALGKVDDLNTALINQCGCDSSLLTKKWIHNHYQWIVWKLACMERRFAVLLGGHYLTHSRVLHQLRMRYDKELCKAVRPAIRKVLNRDVASSRPMVLCVSQILKTSSSKTQSHQHQYVKLELTDGWYSLPALLDLPLSTFVRSGKIQIGTKLLICNAVLVGADDGVDPLDNTYCSSRSNCPVVLKIGANATRLAKWDATLGFVPPSQLMQNGGDDSSFRLRSFRDVIPDGGTIPLVDIVVCRRVPLLFLVKTTNNNSDKGRGCADDSGNATMILTEVQEMKAQKESEIKRQRALEKAAETAEKTCLQEVEKQAPLQWKRMSSASSPFDYYEKLPQNEKRIVDLWKEKRYTLMQDLMQKTIDETLQENEQLETRESTPFIKLMVKTLQRDEGTHCGRINKIDNNVGAILTVWNVSEDQLSRLKEGNVLRIKNVAVKPSLRDEMLQLSANKKTRFQELPFKTKPSPHTLQLSGYQPRCFASMIRAHIQSKKMTLSSQSSSLLRGDNVDIDVIGVVLRLTTEKCHDKDDSILRRIYMTDESGLILRLEKRISAAAAAEESDCFGTAGPWTAATAEKKVYAIRDVRVSSFDQTNGCAVVLWTNSSSLYLKKDENRKGNNNSGVRNREDSLKKWFSSKEGQLLCNTVLESFDAGVPIRGRHFPNNMIVMIGYICDVVIEGERCLAERLCVFPSSSSSINALKLKVDCGNRARTMDDAGAKIFDVILPLYLLRETLRLCHKTSSCGIQLNGGHGSDSATSGGEEPLININDVCIDENQLTVVKQW
eukprot:CAMPEP_0172480112 /NCGR_PEP_ID=MMETSP1066-20121228/5055_1 /TAXON_ID=671091 /ORGANISM="Coscinodiscus wailesii, Strain CCMP2513" /LENGTH=1175 /DNA_ID=CAMNT_0013241137 /DNA_START=62 /DNA_END=3586 /DNA_ORIENTATION=+